MQYRHTFYSFETGGQMKRRVFLEGTDVIKAEIFASNKGYRKPIDNKVATWVKEGWATWEEEKPEWFTDQWKSTVPEDMKPTKGKRGVDDEDKTAAEVDQEKTPWLGEEEKLVRQSSILSLISAKKEPKILPADGRARVTFDEKEFMKEIKRMESMGM